MSSPFWVRSLGWAAGTLLSRGELTKGGLGLLGNHWPQPWRQLVRRWPECQGHVGTQIEAWQAPSLAWYWVMGWNSSSTHRLLWEQRGALPWAPLQLSTGPAYASLLGMLLCLAPGACFSDRLGLFLGSAGALGCFQMLQCEQERWNRWLGGPTRWILLGAGYF